MSNVSGEYEWLVQRVEHYAVLTKNMSHFEEHQQARIKNLEEDVLRLKILIDDLTNIRNVNDIDEKWWGIVDRAREDLTK